MHISVILVWLHILRNRKRIILHLLGHHLHGSLHLSRHRWLSGRLGWWMRHLGVVVALDIRGWLHRLGLGLGLHLWLHLRLHLGLHLGLHGLRMLHLRPRSRMLGREWIASWGWGRISHLHPCRWTLPRVVLGLVIITIHRIICGGLCSVHGVLDGLATGGIVLLGRLDRCTRCVGVIKHRWVVLCWNGAVLRYR